MPLQITVDGEAYNFDDLTVDQYIEMEKVAGASWIEINLAPTATAKRAKAVFVGLVTAKLGAEKAAELVGGMTYKQMAQAVEYVDDDRPAQHANGIPVVDPKAGSGAPGTSGSSGAPASSDGPRT